MPFLRRPFSKAESRIFCGALRVKKRQKTLELYNKDTQKVFFPTMRTSKLRKMKLEKRTNFSFT